MSHQGHAKSDCHCGDPIAIVHPGGPAVVDQMHRCLSSAHSALRSRAGVASDVHQHLLRHFQSTELDRVISESQKQVRMGWATVHNGPPLHRSRNRRGSSGV
ncbi:MAG: hypothetical protein M3Y91_06850 [Actinomycetota bacterium]|nr:hypothetical protein [Actinomycetota bacterium]